MTDADDAAAAEEKALADLIATFPVASPEQVERLDRIRAEVARKHEEKWGPSDPDADVNVRKWSDPVELRVVRPAPGERDEDAAGDP